MKFKNLAAVTFAYKTFAYNLPVCPKAKITATQLPHYAIISLKPGDTIHNVVRIRPAGGDSGKTVIT